VKKTVVHREITLAIGILIAMVIALTLWMKTPASENSGSDSRPRSVLPSAARNLLNTTIDHISTHLFPQTPI